MTEPWNGRASFRARKHRAARGSVATNIERHVGPGWDAVPCTLSPFALLISRSRLDRGKSQAETAFMASVSATTLQRWEESRTLPESFARARGLCFALRIDRDELRRAYEASKAVA